MNGDKTASVESHEALAVLREALRCFHGTAQDSTVNLRQKVAQYLSEIDQIVQAQQRYVDSLESDAANSDDEEEQCNTEELNTARDRLDELEAAQAEAETIVSEIEGELNHFGTVVNELIPRATDFLRVKLDALNEKAAIRIETVSEAGTIIGMASPATRRAVSQTQIPTGSDATDSLQDVPLPDGYHWISLSEIDLATELAGVESQSDFKKVDYSTMRRGLETFRKNVVPMLKGHQGRSVWDLNALFRDQDVASGTSYEHGLQRAFEAFFSQEDAIYLNRGRQDHHFRITNGRHRIKAALDAGWTEIPARTKDLRQ